MTDPVNPFNTPPTPPNPEATPPSPTDNFVDLLNTIQNENGEPKYKDVSSALTALGHSQQHITTLESEKVTREQELQTVRDELASKKSVEDFVNQFTAKQETPSAPAVTEGLDEQKVADLINRQLQASRTADTQESNLQGVLGKLNELYGDKAGDVITAKASEFGTTAAALETIAKDNPSMAMAILGGAEVSSQQKPTSSSVTLNAQPKPTEYKKPEQSLMRGATGSDLAEAWAGIKKDVHTKFGVE